MVSLKLNKLKDLRIKYQYYIDEDGKSEEDLKRCFSDTKEIIIELNDFFDNLNEDKIKEIRKKFNEL